MTHADGPLTADSREIDPTLSRAATTEAVGRILDTAPLTRRRIALWALAAAGIALDGFDLFIMSAAGPLVTEDLQLGSWGTSIAVGAAVLGAVPGALLSGRLADRIGRQSMLRVDIAIFAVTAVLAAFAPNVWFLAFFRFLQGFAVGAEYPLSASLVAETMPARSRARWITGAFAFQALGMVLAAGVAFAVLAVYPEPNAWRWMLLAGVVPAVIVALLRRGVPESPRWEAGRGEVQRAVDDTQWLTGVPVVVRPEDVAAARATLAANVPKARYRDLFVGPIRRITVLCAVPWFVMDIAMYGIGLFAPAIILRMVFPNADADTTDTSFLRDDFEATAVSGITDIFLIVGFALTILFVRRIGEIRLQVVGFVGMTAALATLAFTGEDGDALVVFAAFAVFNLMVNFGPNATTYMLPAQLYPTSVRASGHGLSAASGKVGGVIGTFALTPAVAAFGLGPVMGGIAVLAALGAVVTLLLRVDPGDRLAE